VASVGAVSGTSAASSALPRLRPDDTVGPQPSPLLERHNRALGRRAVDAVGMPGIQTQFGEPVLGLLDVGSRDRAIEATLQLVRRGRPACARRHDQRVPGLLVDPARRHEPLMSLEATNRLRCHRSVNAVDRSRRVPGRLERSLSETNLGAGDGAVQLTSFSHRTCINGMSLREGEVLPGGHVRRDSVGVLLHPYGLGLLKSKLLTHPGGLSSPHDEEDGRTHETVLIDA
jgi:hypothetical protein